MGTAHVETAVDIDLHRSRALNQNQNNAGW